MYSELQILPTLCDAAEDNRRWQLTKRFYK